MNKLKNSRIPTIIQVWIYACFPFRPTKIWLQSTCLPPGTLPQFLDFYVVNQRFRVTWLTVVEKIYIYSKPGSLINFDWIKHSKQNHGAFLGLSSLFNTNHAQLTQPWTHLPDDSSLRMFNEGLINLFFWIAAYTLHLDQCLCNA